MKNEMSRAPGSLLSPEIKKRVNAIRYGADVIGIGALFIFEGSIPSSWHWLATLYFILAWTAILLIDPTCLPEASTTRIKQWKAFKMSMMNLPPYLVICYITSFFQTFRSIGLGLLSGLFFTAVVYETYYRNIIQVMFRKWGMPAWAAVLLQSALFGLTIGANHSPAAALGSFMIAVVNGWISYKTRSILWNTLVLFLWLIFIHS